MHTRYWRAVACLSLAAVMASCTPWTAGAGVSEAAPGLPRSGALDRELEAIVTDPVVGMASLSVLVVRDGEIAYRRGFGHRRIDPEDASGNRPAGPDTLYRIASVSKLITALGVMRLVEEGKLALDRDVADYLGYPLRNPAYPERPLTLRMLLSHTSSLRDDGGYSWGAQVALGAALRNKQQAWDPRHRPGDYFSYSNLNWSVIGTVMEAASGERFDRLMQRLVLAPLDMRGGFQVAAMAPVARENLATLYRKKPAGTAAAGQGGWVAQVDDYHTAPPAAPAGLAHYTVGSNGSLFSPTGGLRASADDLGKVMRMLLDDGRHEGRAFLSRASMAAVFSTQWRHDPALRNGDTHGGLFTHWGLGAQGFGAAYGERSRLVPEGDDLDWGHLGEAYGLLSVFALDFEKRSGVVVLIGGTASIPARTPGNYSALSRQEELVLTALHRHVLAPGRR